MEVESRLALGGGIDARSDLFHGADRVVDMLNLHFRSAGSLTKRKGAAQIVRVLNAAANTANNPQYQVALTQSTGGSLADDTYTVYVVIASQIPTSIERILDSESVVVAAGGGTASILVDLYAVNNGNGHAGINSTVGFDDPFSGGFFSQTSVKIYAKKGSDTITLQAHTLVSDFTSGVGKYTWKLSAYTTTGAVWAQVNYRMPMRGMVWYEEARAMVGWSGDYPVSITASAVTVLGTGVGLARDKNAFYYAFSSTWTKIYTVTINGLLVAFDGIGQPKALDCGAAGPGSFSPTQSRWKIIGANPPIATPTAASPSAGSVPTGTYLYKYTHVYQTFLPDGASYTYESNGSAVLSHTVSAGPKQVDFTVAVQRVETGHVGFNIYRSIAGGSTLYFNQYTTATGAASIPDNKTDAQLDTTQTTPDDTGKIEHGIPPASLYFPAVHDNRIFAVAQKWVLASYKIKDLLSTSEINFTKAGEPDYWPTAFVIEVGRGRISGMVEVRGAIYVFKSDEIGIIEGSDETSYAYKVTSTGIGAMRHSIVVVSDVIYFWNESLGPCRMNGYSAEPIGIDSIQQKWVDARIISAGTDYQCREAVYYQSLNEIHWIFQSDLTGLPVFFTLNSRPVEYVLYLPTGAWSYNEDTNGVTYYDRQITAACNAPTLAVGAVTSQLMRPYWCDTYGRVCREYINEYDSDPTDSTQLPIAFNATFPYFFGGKPRMMKLFRFLYVLFRMGNTGADYLSVYAYLFGTREEDTAPSPTSWQLLQQYLVSVVGGYKELEKRADIPVALGNTHARGLRVKITGVAKDGPVRIQGLESMFKEISETRT